jgi:hypothetical protein
MLYLADKDTGLKIILVYVPYIKRAHWQWGVKE